MKGGAKQRHSGKKQQQHAGKQSVTIGRPHKNEGCKADHKMAAPLRRAEQQVRGPGWAIRAGVALGSKEWPKLI